MKTKTTAEAMALLERYKADRLAVAREIADDLITRNGETTTKDVCDVLRARGLVEGEKLYFLGALFNRPKKYIATGRVASGIVGPNAHSGNSCKVWTFAA